jgi:hypothetical protein
MLGGRAGVSLGVLLRRGHVVRSVARLCFRVGSPLLIHGVGQTDVVCRGYRCEQGRWEPANSAVTQLTRAVHAELRAVRGTD